MIQKTIKADFTRGWCIYGFFCKKFDYNWMLMKSLQLTAEAGHKEDFFKDTCVNKTNDIYSCSEPCDGVYRTFSGCCNNLINKQYGQIVKFEHQKYSLKISYRKGECSPKEVSPFSLPFKQNSAQGGTGQLFSS